MLPNSVKSNGSWANNVRPCGYACACGLHAATINPAKSRFPQEDAARKEDENGHARNPIQQACKPSVREVTERHAAVERGHGQQVEQPEQGTRAGKPVRDERVRQCGERKAGRRSGEADGGVKTATAAGCTAGQRRRRSGTGRAPSRRTAE